MNSETIDAFPAAKITSCPHCKVKPLNITIYLVNSKTPSVIIEFNCCSKVWICEVTRVGNEIGKHKVNNPSFN